MPAILTNADDFVSNSDFPRDKIVVIKTGSFSIPGGTTGVLVKIPHSLSFHPLCNGNWSLSSTFDLQYNFGTGIFPSSVSGFIFDTNVNVFSDISSIYLAADNVSSSGKVIYYRIYGLHPPEDNSDIPPVASLGDDFVYNSDYNYPKIYLNNFYDFPATGGTDGTFIVPHTLNKITQAAGWMRTLTYNGTASVQAVHPVESTNGYYPGTNMIVNPNSITFFTKAGTSAHRAYYILYLDT